MIGSKMLQKRAQRDVGELCLAKTQQLSVFGSRVAEFVQEHTLSLNLAMIA